MAECRDFFEDSAGPSRSSPLPKDSPPSDLHQGNDDVGAGAPSLELTLGPTGSLASPPRHPLDMVRASSPYSFPQRQPSGNFASCLPATAYASHTPHAQIDGPKMPIGQQHIEPAGLARQRSGNFSCSGEHLILPLGSRADAPLPPKALLPEGGSAFPSRDQIWQTLQKSGTLFEPPQLPNDAPSMWSRRAASMQAAFPRNFQDDLEHCQIRRSSSNGVLARGVSRQLSNVDSALERSPQQSMGSTQPPHQHEDLEDLQKRKEMQAQRRLEARKRRRILIGDKQSKKGRQGSGILPTGSRQSIFPNNKVSQGGVPSGEDDVATESHCTSLEDPRFGGSDESKRGMQELPLEEGKNDMQASSIEDAERLSQETQAEGAKSNASFLACGKYSSPAKDKIPNSKSNEHESPSQGSKISSELEHPGTIIKCSVSLTSGNEYECLEPHAVTNHPRLPVSDVEAPKPFLGSYVENSRALTDATKEGCGMRGSIMSLLCNGAAGCPPLLCSPMQYAYSAGGAPPTSTTTQPISPFPYMIQNPSAGNCRNNSTVPSLPTVQAACPPATNTFTGSFPLSSGAFLSRTMSAAKDFVGDSEGKRGIGERSAFSPLPRTTSNSKMVFGEPQYSGVHLDLPVALAASQPSSTSTVVSDSSNSKSMLLERQPSRSLGGRLLSQNSCIVDQAFLWSHQEKSIPGESVKPLPTEASFARLGNTSRKQEEGARQEEESSESQLASEHSGVDASYAQSVIIEKQRSGSCIDLPWVSTTGKGPNGKTINGVMYIADGRQVRLVCSCHGKHMSPVEFVEHSGSSDLSNPERSIVVSPFPHFNYQVSSTPV